ncbi:hypothetical protein F5Y17DRAFT_323360 [Xylariaceae sp. FL0594]|nr:hypothetical protein F5Y17DRAFT_323360 [Xylariaceae sp. FL0594]
MRVAIAGYGDLARYLCDEFVGAGHDLVILTRSAKPHLERRGVAQNITDYTLPSLKLTLADCDVLISTISDTSPAYTSVHYTLLQACRESTKCKRFVPAEFAADIETYPDQPGFYYAPHEPVREALRGQSEVEWTLVCIGWLADYFVPSGNRHIKDIAKYHPVDWACGKMVIPGTGNEPVDFTWARDVAKALASLLDAPHGSWQPYTFMAGERSCWNGAIELVKRNFGLDFPVEHVSLHSVVEMIKRAKDEDTLTLADYYLLSISGACASPPEKVESCRKKYFSNVRFRTLQDGLSQLESHPDTIL